MCGESGAVGPISLPGSSKFYAVVLQRLKRFAQRAHTVEAKRHVIHRVRMWRAFEEPNDERFVCQREGLVRAEHYLQIEVLGPKVRALLRVTDGEAEMPDGGKLYFQVRSSS